MSMRLETRQMKAKVLATITAGLMAITSFAASAADLRVGTHPTFAPFEFLDSKTREYVGFDIDMINEIGKRAGMDVKLVNMGFDGLIPALMTGSIDIAASGITITEERKKKVDFCDPYYRAGQGMMVKAGNETKFKDVKSLEGRTVAVQIGTTGAEFAKTIKDAKIKAFNTSAEAFMDLRMGGADAVITDRPVIGYFIVKNPRAAKGLVQVPVTLDTEFFGYALKKGNTELLKKVNDALASMKADGTYDKIYKKWFGS